MSLDGKIATSTGQSNGLQMSPLVAMDMCWRATHDAMLVELVQFWQIIHS